MPRRLLLLAFFASSLALSGCGVAVYQPARQAGFELDPSHEISDADVRAAFEARPQIPERIRVAHFSFGRRGEGVGEILEASPRVIDSYAIPALMVTGERRFDDAPPYGRREPNQAPSMKKLRLMAARAKSDVLVVFDYGYRVRQTPNGWAATAVLLLPMFFAPMADFEVESYLDAYVIDVKNGYLYAQISTSLRDEATIESLFSTAGERLTAAQRAELEATTGRKLTRLFEDPDLHLPAPAEALAVTEG